MAHYSAYRSDSSETATLQQYLNEISRYSSLSHDKERELAGRVQDGDEEAVRELVVANLRFVVAYSKRYRGSTIPFLDIIHEGNLGLIQAAKKYDPFKEGQDVKFITYAVWWIRQAILHFLAENGSTFRLPQKQANTLYRLERVRTVLAERLGRSPTNRELSEELEVSLEDVRVLRRASLASLSLNSHVDESGDSELGTLLEQTIFPDSDETILRQSFAQALGDALDGLPEREREVLALRYGLNDDQPRTLREIGALMGLSRERVRQIESRALSRLRRSHLTQDLIAYLRT
ncbi:MAG: RNA polymerase sigma factor RpoD/SigA [Acidobacteriota bacterium]